MSSIFDLSRHISQLVREEKYIDALNYFKRNKINYLKEQIGRNEYLISDIVSCLRKTNYFDEGFKFLSIYDIKISSETKEKILTAYGWLLWSKYKAENSNLNENLDNKINHFDEDEENIPQADFHYNKTELIIKIEELIPLLYQNNSDFSRTLISFLFSIVLKSEKKKPAPNWKLINDFCDEFNPDNLSTECVTIEIERKGRKKDMELASDKENWFAYKTKALLKLGEWQKCFDTSKTALEVLDNFHYSNDIWFARRIALSKNNLGNSEDTIAELLSILRKKKEWFIQKELADLYFEENDLENSFKFATQAITNFGPLEFKVDLLYLFGKILSRKNETDLAFKHFSLSKLIRQNEEWKVPQKVFDELKNFETEEINIKDLGKLKSELKRFWNTFSPEKKRIHKEIKGRKQGQVIRIMNDNERGKDGFLNFNNKDFYFSLPYNNYLTPKIKVGMKVEFEIHPSKDGGKKRTKITKIVSSC